MKTINLEIPVEDWVEWIASDDSGSISGFSAKPELKEDEGWFYLEEGREATLTIGRFTNPNWQQSLRKV